MRFGTFSLDSQTSCCWKNKGYHTYSNYWDSRYYLSFSNSSCAITSEAVLTTCQKTVFDYLMSIASFILQEQSYRLGSYLQFMDEETEV